MMHRSGLISTRELFYPAHRTAGPWGLSVRGTVNLLLIAETEVIHLTPVTTGFLSVCPVALSSGPATRAHASVPGA